MKTLRRLSRRQVAFVTKLFLAEGNASEAARLAGYGPSGAPTMGCLLLQNDLVLELVAAECQRGRIGGDAVLRRLRLPSRQRQVQIRFEMLLARHQPPAKLAGTDQRPFAVVDTAERAMRDHAVKFAEQLGLSGTPGTDLGTEKTTSTPKATDPGNIFD